MTSMTIRFKSIFLLLPLVLLFNRSAWSQENITVTNMEQINTPALEFSPSFYHHGLVYVSSQYRHGRKDNKVSENTYDLYYSDLGPKGKASKPAPLSLKVNTRYHEGPVAFSDNFKKMYFTQSNLKNKVPVADDMGVVRLKIHEASKGREDWENIKELPFNSIDYSCMHPSITEDGSRLYFASNMHGGFGGMDIYYVEMQNGTWSKPINLGKGINTADNEVFPYIHPSGKLFFSSDRKGGMGGLDIYMADVRTSTPGKVELLPAPINSSHDDLDIFLNQPGTMGYFASDRPGGKGRDDIYRFDAPDGLKGLFPAKKFDAIVRVVNRETGEPLENAKVRVVEVPERTTIYSMRQVFRSNLVRNQNGDQLIRYTVRDRVFEDEGTALSQALGQLTVQLLEHKKFLVLVQKEGFQNDFEEFTTHQAPATAPIIEVGLWPSPKPVVQEPPTLQVGSIIVLDQIYYDFDKSYIRTDASRGLNAILILMEQYPAMEIELAAHTDSRGTKEYNQILSDRRAESAKYYLTSRGIANERINAFGKGETTPRNRCSDGVRCSEEEHQYNRRTEIRITKLREPDMKIQYIDNPPEYIDKMKRKN